MRERNIDYVLNSEGFALSGRVFIDHEMHQSFVRYYVGDIETVMDDAYRGIDDDTIDHELEEREEDSFIFLDGVRNFNVELIEQQDEFIHLIMPTESLYLVGQDYPNIDYIDVLDHSQRDAVEALNRHDLMIVDNAMIDYLVVSTDSQIRVNSKEELMAMEDTIEDYRENKYLDLRQRGYRLESLGIYTSVFSRYFAYDHHVPRFFRMWQQAIQCALLSINVRRLLRNSSYVLRLKRNLINRLSKIWGDFFSKQIVKYVNPEFHYPYRIDLI